MINGTDQLPSLVTDDALILQTICILIIFTYRRVEIMFPYTDSEYIVDELYGTGKSISPQIGITYVFGDSHSPSLSSPQQTYPEERLTRQKSMVVLKQEPICNILTAEDEQAGQSQSAKQNLLDSLLNDELGNSIKQEKSFRKNHQVENLLLVIEQLRVSHQQKDIEIIRLRQVLAKFEAKENNALQLSTDNNPIQQITMSKNSPLVQKLSRKLRLQRQKNEQLEKLIDKVKETEIQSKEMYKAQIQYLKLQLEYQREKNTTQKIQLQEALKEHSRQIIIRPVARPLDHQCDLCRQYELLSSLSKLKSQIEQMRMKEQELKAGLRMMTNERNSLKDLLQKQGNSPNTTPSKRC